MSSAALNFDEARVSHTFEAYSVWIAERCLGLPLKVTSLKLAGDTMRAVGCEWPGEVRLAVKLPPDATDADEAELLKRLEHWKGAPDGA